MLKWLKDKMTATKAKDARPAKRIDIHNVHNILLFVEIKKQNTYRNFNIQNISSSGIAFFCENPTELFQNGDIVKAEIDIYQMQSLKIEMKVVHFTKGIVGCQVANIECGYSDLVSRYFDSELEAKKSKKYNSEELTNTLLGHPLLFSSENSELYLIYDGDKVVSYKIKYHGHEISRSKAKQFNIMIAFNNQKTADGTFITKVSHEIPFMVFTQIKRYIENIEGLEQTFKISITQELETISVK